MPEQYNFKPSSKCIGLIKHFEGFYPKAYQGKADRPGVITIGYGSIMYADGSKPKLGDTIGECQATKLLEWEVGIKTAAVNSMLKNVLIVQCQFDALVSFAYNLGIGALQGSTLLKKIRRNPLDPEIQAEFSKWIYSNGKRVSGLIRRRKSEWHLYHTGELDFYE